MLRKVFQFSVRTLPHRLEHDSQRHFAMETASKTRLARESARKNSELKHSVISLSVPPASDVRSPFTAWLLSPMIATLSLNPCSVPVFSIALRLGGQKG